MKPDWPPNLQVESPDWTSYSNALQEAINRFQSTPLAPDGLRTAQIDLTPTATDPVAVPLASRRP